MIFKTSLENVYMRPNVILWKVNMLPFFLKIGSLCVKLKYYKPIHEHCDKVSYRGSQEKIHELSDLGIKVSFLPKILTAN